MPASDDAEEQILDVSQLRNFAFWFIAGVVVVVAAQAVYVSANGGDWAYLIRVGEQSVLRPRITAELGDIRATDPMGHDGQMCYLIARDPWDRDGTSELMQNLDPQYRYRRILYPALSGGFGNMSPRSTLLGLIACLAIGAGISAVAIADIAFQRRLPGVVALLCLTNPGTLLSAVSLTPDVLASGLGFGAVAFWLRGKMFPTVVCLLLATLTKETHFLFAAGIAFTAFQQGQRRVAVTVFLVPLIAFAAWSCWCWMNVFHGSSPLHNFTLPGAGILAAARQWLQAEAAPQELVTNLGLGILGITMIAVITIASLRSDNRVISVCGLLWALVAVTTSISVWAEPTNLIRVAAPLWPLAWINGVEAVNNRSKISDD